MAQTNKQLFQAVTVLPLALLALGSYYIWDKTFVTHPDGEILVITVTDPASPSSYEFSSQVLSGVKRAYDELQNEKRAKFEEVPIPWTDASHFVIQVSRAISQRKAIGIISGGTSQTDAPLTKLCTQLHIPVLLTVSTNDSLTHEPAKAHRTIFRLLPNNEVQARTIADEALAYVSPQRAPREPLGGVAVFHETNDYGSLLFTKVAKRLRDHRVSVFEFAASKSDEIYGPLPILEHLKSRLSVVVFLGYSSHAAELLQGLSAYGINLPIILSDGCYSTGDLDLGVRSSALDLKNVSLVFPTQIKPAANQGLRGFGTYGYNAYLLLNRWATEPSPEDEAQSLTEIFNNNNQQMFQDSTFHDKHPDLRALTFFRDKQQQLETGELSDSSFYPSCLTDDGCAGLKGGK